MDKAELRKVLDAHGKWTRGENGGVKANLTRAYLGGADLARANLTRANLAGADLTGAYLPGANLTRANLTRAYLGGAYLTGANLTRAYLGGADLARANLTGATIDANRKQVIACWLNSGAVLSYSWMAFRMRDGSVVLRYGCEQHTLDAWPDLLRGLCEKHEEAQAGEYERNLRALIEFVRVCAAEGAPDA